MLVWDVGDVFVIRDFNVALLLDDTKRLTSSLEFLASG